MSILEELNSIINFEIPNIPNSKRFWMIRTQKGFFYNEYINNNYVAIAWNNINKNSDFSTSGTDKLKVEILRLYPDIKRPSLVINKCKHFIQDVKPGDIIIIPDKGSQNITLAKIGDYFECEDLDVNIENETIYKIDNKDILGDELPCPYKKRRKIRILRTLSTDDLNLSLYKAISSYHGICNLDEYAYDILNMLYNVYTYLDKTCIVYNVRKTNPIKPSELSKLMYSNYKCLSQIIDEYFLSTKLTLNSPGDIVYILQGAYNHAKDGWVLIVGLLILFGGGSAATIKFPGLINIIKNALSITDEAAKSKQDRTIKDLEITEKALDIYNKAKEMGIDPHKLNSLVTILDESAKSLETTPIICQEDPIDDTEGDESNG